METDQLLKSFRKKPLFDRVSLPAKLDYGQPEIQRIIPHRAPLLFVDRLLAVDFTEGLLVAERTMNYDDPIFGGHFPDYPVYPGNFTVESIGQAGLCLHYFVVNQRSDIGAEAKPVQLRATKIAGALFIEPIRPGDTVTFLIKKLSFDGYFASVIGQALVNGLVSVVTVGEVMLLDD